ncbi:hypothetical protein DOTSEDRAFT_28223 [Dothistroma septosporum NZE10]|uniref:Uncharacterized protein n=1 Tax=Dothistroma septosporum (strain NZE10 / CBS 128990) TaxID=675120 RepID=N1PDZ8_DOTSN|nr:hypothetical protein DOTSEDRAFT_28223 [Dothistroma septosporum NZE10]
MAPAVARSFVNLDSNNITIFYPADSRSDTAIASRDEEIERQIREPGYAPTCFRIDNPQKEKVKIQEDGDSENDLKRKLCDFLGYDEHEYQAPSKTQRLQPPPHYAVAPDALSRRDSIQAAHQPSRQTDSELTPGFATEARHAASMQAARMPQSINNDRFRNAPASSLAPPNPAVVTRRLYTPVHTPQSHPQRHVSRDASQGTSMPSTFVARQQPLSEAQYATSMKAAAETRQHSSPRTTPSQISGGAWTPQRLPATTLVQNQSSKADGSPHMPGLSPPRIDSPQAAWSGHTLHPDFPHLSADKKYWVTNEVENKFMQPLPVIEPRRTTEQLQQAREQIEELKRRQAEHETRVRNRQEEERLKAERNAKTRAQEEARHREEARRKQAARRGRLSDAALAATYNFDLARSPHQISESAKQPRGPERTVVVQPDTTRKRSQDVAGSVRKVQQMHEPQHSHTVSVSQPLQAPSSYPVSRYATKTFVDGTPPQRRLTAAQLEMTPERKVVHNGPFRDQRLNVFFPVVLDAKGQEVQVPIGLSEAQILLLLTRTSWLHPMIHDGRPQDRRQRLQRYYATHRVAIDRWLQQLTPSPEGRTLSQQQKSPSAYRGTQSPVSRPPPQQQRSPSAYQQAQFRPSQSQEPLPVYQQQRASLAMPRQDLNSAPNLGIEQQQQGIGIPKSQYSKSKAAERTGATAVPSILPYPFQHSAQSPPLISQPVHSPPTQSSRPDPTAPGAKVGSNPVPVDIQQIVFDIKALPKTKEGLPVRKGLRAINRDYFTSGGIIVRRNKGEALLEWYRDDRLFTEEEWYWLRFTAPKRKAMEA